MISIRCKFCHTLNGKREGNKIMVLVGYGKRKRFIIFEAQGASMQCYECKKVFHLDERRENGTYQKSGSVKRGLVSVETA